MNLVESFLVAIEGLRSNKMRSGLTMLGVVIGVFAVIILVSVGQGVKQQVTGQVQQFGPNLIMVMAGKMEIGSEAMGSGTKPLKYEDALYLEQHLKNVVGVAGTMESVARVERGRAGGQVTLQGTPANMTKIMPSYAPAMGRFYTEAQVNDARRVVAIGNTVREDLFGSENPIGKTVTISGRRFRVIAVLKKVGRMFGVDADRAAFIPITAAREVLGGETVSSIMVLPKEGAGVSRTVAGIRRVMSKRLGKDDFSVITMGQMVGTFQSILSILTAVLGGIAAISLLVGGIGIMNIMLVSVTERTREIGIRKAVGARRIDILAQFIIESVVLSLVGGLTGILLGFLVSEAINRVTTSLPSSITPWSVALAFFFSAGVGIFFGVYPAWKASRLNPIDALRYE